MTELTNKILRSGLVDEQTARLLERWGTLPQGSAELAKNNQLRDATREELMKFADEIGEEVEKSRRLKEQMLDLNQIRWPVVLTILRNGTSGNPVPIAIDVTGVIDLIGRYYFRPQDSQTEWFVPGYIIKRFSGEYPIRETILEVTPLFVGDQVAAIQISTEPE